MANEIAKQEHDPETGEIVERATMPAMIDNAGLSTIVRAELDAQIVTAKQFPRSIQRVIGNITTLATLDEETASECLYALVRKKKQQSRDPNATGEENKPIEGPSIRLAEIAAQTYGNCRIEARVIAVNRQEKYVEAEGVFLDLETNMASKATVRRRISTSKGFLFSDDMINVTSNAACAIAKRNAILAGIPRGIYRPAYTAARSIVAGTAETLAANREKAIKAFATFGVTPDQIFDALGVEGEREIKTDHIATLRAMFATLKNGEGTVEEMFGKSEPDHRPVSDPLNDDGPGPKGPRGATARMAEADHVEDADGATVKDRNGQAAQAAQEGATPAAATAAAAEPEKAASADPAPAAEASDSAPEAPDDADTGEPPTAAYLAGRDARKRGISGRTVPADFASDETAAGDWIDGWKDENAAQKAGGGK